MNYLQNVESGPNRGGMDLAQKGYTPREFPPPARVLTARTMEDTQQLYKDFRFWIAGFALGLLAWMILKSYPM